MKTKRLIALLLVSVLAIGLIGCGKKTNETDSKNTSKTEDPKGSENTTNPDDNKESEKEASDDEGTSGNDATGTEDGWSWPLAEKKELSMWLQWTCNYATDPNELVTIKKLEELTNVHINWTTVGGQEAMEKFGLMMASGNYPDILRGAESYYTGGLVQAVEDGITLDMTEYIPKYMPTYNALRTSIPKLEKDTVTDDGRLVGIYTLASNFGEIRGERVWDGMCIRKDWLDELNMPLPVTIDDWHETLKAFKDTFNCEAPLLIGASNGYDLSHNFLSAYGVLGEFYQENGTVKFGPLEDGYKQWVQLFRDWYAEGLIDPNFTNNDATFSGSADYIGTGRAGASAAIWGVTADTYKLQGYNDDPDFFLSGVTTPVLNEGDVPQMGSSTNEMTKETLSITKNCKDVELACRWLDYWYDHDNMVLQSVGIEDETYYRDETGEYYVTDSVYDRVAAGEYPSVQELFSSYTLMTSTFGLYNWQMLNVTARGNRALEAYDFWDQSHFDYTLPTHITMTPEDTAAFNTTYTAIKTLVQENTIKFITGTQSMDDYDKFVQTLYDYGIEKCIGYKQSALDRYNAR